MAKSNTPVGAEAIPEAAIYCRVSTQEQFEEGVSLQAQENCCRSFCQRKGLKVRAVFVEKGESGRTTDRPALQGLLSHCSKNRNVISAIVVYKIDRLSRNKNAYFAMQVHLRKLGISIYSATEPLGDDSPIARLLEGILASVSEFESDLVSQRTAMSMEHARACGRIVHRPPIGYIMIKGDGDASRAVPDPERSWLVKLAFEMMATGTHTQQNVLEHITRLGLTTKRGAPLTIQSFRRMLFTRTYSGWVRVSDSKGYAHGTFEPLISDELYERVQLILRMRRTHPHSYERKSNDFPLRGFIICGYCGTLLTACWSKGRVHRYPYYKCRVSGCRFGNVRREILEKEFVRFLEKAKPSQQSWDTLIQMLRSTSIERRKDRERSIEKLCELKSGLIARRVKLREAFLYDSIIDREVYEEETERLSMKLLEVQLELEREEPLPEDIVDLAERAATVLYSCDLLWQLGSPDEKRELQRAILPEGIGYADREWVRTAGSTCPIDIYSAFWTQKERLATPTGFEPVLPA